MDDLSGLDWNAATAPAKVPAAPQGNYYATFRPTPPISGRSTPSLTQASLGNPQVKSPLPSKPSTPANDSFANLVSFGGNQASKNQSLQEKQRVLQEQKTKQIWGNQAGNGSTFDIPDEGRWSQNGGTTKLVSSVRSPPVYAGTNEYGGPKLSASINRPFATIAQASSGNQTKSTSIEGSSRREGDDLLAIFAADALVDSSSNHPKLNTTANIQVDKSAEDDDPFGLGVPSQKMEAVQPRPNGALTDDDDVLGLLGRPVSELPARRPETLEIPSLIEEPSESHPRDKAIAELVEMGFSADVSRDALESTSSGLDVQAAVSIILNQAHDKSRQQTRSSPPKVQVDRPSRTRPPRKESPDPSTSMPAWMRQQGSSATTPRREDSRSPAVGDMEPAKYAAELGNTLFKTANSLWKTGTKKLNQAVSDLNSDSDASQPKWMRDASPRPVDPAVRVSVPSSRTAARMKTLENKPVQGMTDEALLLEARDEKPQSRRRTQAPTRTDNTTTTPAVAHEKPLAISQRPTQRDSNQPPSSQLQIMNGGSRPKVNRQLVEEQSSQAYISPARRKTKPTAPPAPEIDLLDSSKKSPPTARSQPPYVTSRHPQIPTASLPKPSPSPRPQTPSRELPTLSPSALGSSTRHRHAGTSHFKAGDYASATTSYTAALAVLPPSHPLSSLILTNRALTHLKTGDPKACIADAEFAITIIGPSKGAGEVVDLGNGEGKKSLPELWGKAMTRRAEALEQLERWNDAAIAWRDCVEAGVGGSTSIQGRSRCEKAAGNSNASTQKRRTEVRKATPASSAISRPASSKPSLRPPSSAVKQQSAQAVSRLRALNAAAERADDEKFALADSVSARVDGWRKGKETNIRALLASLDTVLWDGNDWKKVGMSELIAPGKVKINYQKGIAKVHPDKVSELSCVGLHFPLMFNTPNNWGWPVVMYKVTNETPAHIIELLSSC